MLPNRNIFYLSFLSATEIGEKAPFVPAEIIIGNGGEEVAPFKAPFPRFLSLSRGFWASGTQLWGFIRL